jgi:cardiolipin synthase
LRAGVQLYEWLPGMLHAKALAVDGEWLAVGSYNLDYRSLVYNWEIVAALADEKLCAEFAGDFERGVASATKIEREAWRRRSWIVKLIQWLAYLGRRWL